MKHYLTTLGLTFIAFLSSTQAFAQIDVDSLMYGNSFNKITQLYGQPLERVDDEGHGGSGHLMWLTYADLYAVIDREDSNILAISFWTDDICVLSSYVEGGIKVGDKASTFKDVDFELITDGTHPGRRGIVKLRRPYPKYPSGRWFNYCILSKRKPYHIHFAIEDDIIKEIGVGYPEDVLDPSDYEDEE